VEGTERPEGACVNGVFEAGGGVVEDVVIAVTAAGIVGGVIVGSDNLDLVPRPMPGGMMHWSPRWGCQM